MSIRRIAGASNRVPRRTLRSRRIPPLLILPLLLLSLAASLRTATAQGTGRPVRPMGRLDVIAARGAALQAGVGVGVPVGTYVRLEGTLAGGLTRRGRAVVGGGRADVVGRFLVDPFAQTARGPYAGGGLSVRDDAGDRARVYLLALVGVEGRRQHGVYPALELGVGGGVRLGIALRAAPADRR